MLAYNSIKRVVAYAMTGLMAFGLFPRLKAWSEEDACTEKTDSDAVFRFDLPEASAAKNLEQFGVIVDRPVIFMADQVKGVVFKELKGEMTLIEAMQKLVESTRLIINEDKKTGALIVKVIPDDSDSQSGVGSKKKSESNSNETENMKSKSSKLVKSVFSLVTFGLIGTHSIGNAATIRGSVYDSENAIYLESALVELVGTENSTYSERGGKFELDGIPVGSHTVRVSVFGYGYDPIEKSIEVLDDSSSSTLNFSFPGDRVVELEAYVVQAERVAMAKSLSVRKGSESLKEVVASDVIGQFSDRNPAEALSRVSGVTVESDQGEGSFLLIRGTSADLSNIQIDGVSVATPQEDGRRVNLNIITNDQLERIELSKTWLPYQRPVIGGTVDLLTRSALDRGERFASVEGAYTYRTVRPDEASYRGAITYGDVWDHVELFGLDGLKLGFQISFNASTDFSGSDTVDFTWDSEVTFPHLTGSGEETPYGHVLSTTKMSDFNIERDRKAVSSRFEVEINDDHQLYLSVSHNEFDDLEEENTFYMRSYTNDAHDWAGTDSLTLEILEAAGEDPTLAFNANRLAPPGALTYVEATAIGEMGFDAEHHLFTNSLWRLTGYRGYSNQFREDRITTFQVGGDHSFLGSIEANWKAYASKATQDSEEWELRFSSSQVAAVGQTLAGAEYRLPRLEPVNQDSDEDGELDRNEPGLYDLAEDSGGSRYHRLHDSEDNRKGGELNLQFDRISGSVLWTTKLGAAVDFRDKTYNVDNNTSHLILNGLDGSDWEGAHLKLSDEFFYGGEVEDFEDNFGSFYQFGPKFNAENTLAFVKDPSAYGVTFEQDRNQINDNFIDQVLTNYGATEDIYGAYIQETIDWSSFTLILGVRYEKTENTFTNLGITTRLDETNRPDGLPATLTFIPPSIWRTLKRRGYENAFAYEQVTDKDYDDLMPALNFRWKINPRTDLRFCATHTIARPKFSDLIPREVINVSEGSFERTIRTPNFDLMPMESNNYDISLDYYFEPIGLLSVGVFFKDMDGPIYDETRIGVMDEETAEYDYKYDVKNRTLPWDVTTKRNAGRAKLGGIEFTFDRQLDFLPDYFRGLGLSSNVALFESSVKLTTDTREGEKVTMFGQPSMTGNCSLYYNNHNVFARLSYNRRGEYLRSIGTNENIATTIGSSRLDTYVDRMDRVDFTLRYNFENGIQVFADVINLTNEPLVYYINNPVMPKKIQYTETVLSIGVKWNL